MENVNQPIENKIPATTILLAAFIPPLVQIQSISPILYFLLGVVVLTTLIEARFYKNINKYRTITFVFIVLSFLLLILEPLLWFDVFPGKTGSFSVNVERRLLMLFALSVFGAVLALFLTCVLIHFRHGMHKIANSVSEKILNGLVLIILYLCILFHINTFATYANFVYVIKQSNCNGICLHLGVGDLSDVFEEDDKYHPLVSHDPYTPIIECTMFPIGERKKEDWKFKIVDSSEVKKLPLFKLMR